MRKIFVVFFILIGTISTLHSQRIFYCDSILSANGKFLSGKCNYFYNFLTESIDSIVSDGIHSTELLYEEIGISVPIDSLGKMTGFLTGITKAEKVFEINYEKGIPNGYFVQFERYDTVGYVQFIAGKKEGIQVHYMSFKAPSILILSPYKNGLLNGQVVRRVNNKVTRMTRYVDGVKEGADYAFYNTGELDWFLVYEHGKVKDGVYHSFNENGTLKNETVYSNNKIIKIIIYGNDNEVWKIIED